MSQLGGVAIFAGFVAAMLVSLLLTGPASTITRDRYELLRIGLLLLGSLRHLGHGVVRRYS